MRSFKYYHGGLIAVSWLGMAWTIDDRRLSALCVGLVTAYWFGMFAVSYFYHSEKWTWYTVREWFRNLNRRHRKETEPVTV